MSILDGSLCLLSCAALTVAPADVVSAEVVSADASVERPFAKARGLPLAPLADRVVRYTYHESLFATALPLRPQGRLLVNDAPGYRPPKRKPGPKYVVMGSRGRGTPPTSATDIVLDRGTRVVAPVSGRVTNKRRYLLYCRTPDVRVIIRPDSHPHLRVVLFHLDRLSVRKGDDVIAGQSRLGVPRFFANSGAQYDQYVGGDRPHVHVEVEHGDVRPLPGCNR